MLKGQRKVKNVGRTAGSVSGVSFLLLAFLLVNPLVGLSASALEGGEEGGVSTEVGEPMALAETLISTVNIAFTPESGSASLTPISADGASAKYAIKATVGVENSGGYTVYLGSNKSELTGKNTGVTINGVTSSSTYEELPLNSWGYNAIEGETPGTIFSKVPTNNRGDVIASNNSTNIKEDNKTFTLSFAAHIGNDKPADTYKNEITLSVVSSPLEVTGLEGIAAMQEMTPEICEASKVGDEVQLEDVRDGKYYWIAKLADDKCWMTQNLDLDLNTSTTPLTPATSDVSANWTPGDAGKNPAYTVTTATSSTIYANETGQRSWSLGGYRLRTSTTISDCGAGKNSAANCPNQFVAYETPTEKNMDENAHYLLGNFYQWNTATAGSGGTLTSGQATDSICPKGWKLPTSNSSVTGSFGGLINVGTIGTDVAKLTSAPYYFVKVGGVSQTTARLFVNAGSHGTYWSSTPAATNGDAYNLDFSGSDDVVSAANYNKNSGHSVRCIAR